MVNDEEDVSETNKGEGSNSQSKSNDTAIVEVLLMGAVATVVIGLASFAYLKLRS